MCAGYRLFVFVIARKILLPEHFSFQHLASTFRRPFRWVMRLGAGGTRRG